MCRNTSCRKVRNKDSEIKGNTAFSITTTNSTKLLNSINSQTKTMAVQKKYNRNAKTNALGRGLDALISTEAVSTQGSSTINEVALDQIEANPNQPRREFDPVALEELANSIRELGLVQPITLRQVDENRFQIIAGERRWRASQLAGLKAVVVVPSFSK